MADNNQQLPDSPFTAATQQEGSLPDSPFTSSTQADPNKSQGPLSGKYADWYFSQVSTPTSDAATIMSHIGQGAEQGWGSGVNTLSKTLDQALTKAGIYNDHSKNQNDYFKSINEALVRPVVNTLATLGSGALGGVVGGFQGVGAALQAHAKDVEQHTFAQGNPVSATLGEAGEIFGSTPERVPDLHVPELTAQARSKAVIGEGEQGFFNTKPISDENLEARQSAANKAGDAPETVSPPEPPQMDIHQVVRQLDPALFDEVDRLNDIKNNYRDNISYAKSQDIADVQRDIDIHMARTMEDNPGATAIAQGHLDNLNAQMEALKAGEYGPRAQETQATYMENLNKLYDLQSNVASVYQHAQEIMMSPEEIAENPELANPRLQELTDKISTDGLTKQEWNEYNVLSKAQEDKTVDKPTEQEQEPLTVASYVDKYLRGEGRGSSKSDLELQQFAANNAAEIEKEFQKRSSSDNPSKAPNPTTKTNEPITFKTAKGSEYQVNEDGTTTRNKTFRPEHGEAEQGPQPKSEKTFYVTDEEADALGLFQTEGPKKAIRQRNDGTVGVQYLDGKDAGKFEKRTVLTPRTEPEVGLTPVETWKNGERVHFGNKITELNKPEKLKEGSALKPLAQEAGEQKIAGTAKNIEASAVEKGLTKEFLGEETPTFTSTTVKYQAQGIAKLMSKSPEDAKAIAFGEKEAPSDLIPSMIFSAVRQEAERTGDLATIERLARSPVATQMSLHAQSLGMSGKFNELSPTNIIRSIEKARLKASDVAKDAKNFEDIKKSGLSKSKAKGFIKSIECDE